MQGKAGLALAAALTLVACGQREDQIPFDGQIFRSSASSIDGDRRRIAISVRPVSASFDGAREAGRYEATRYCIAQFGNSAVDWVIGPDQDPETYTIADDELILEGTCEG